MTRVTVVKVNGLRGEARKTCLYVGRAFAGWPASPWCNPQRVRANRPVADALAAFRTHMASQPESWWADLWAACRQGELSLGCWCLDWDGVGPTPPCHAAIIGAELNRRFLDGGHS